MISSTKASILGGGGGGGMISPRLPAYASKQNYWVAWELVLAHLVLTDQVEILMPSTAARVMESSCL